MVDNSVSFILEQRPTGVSENSANDSGVNLKSVKLSFAQKNRFAIFKCSRAIVSLTISGFLATFEAIFKIAIAAMLLKKFSLLITNLARWETSCDLLWSKW